MSKKIIENSDLQTLTLSPTNTNDDESTLIPLVHNDNKRTSPPSYHNKNHMPVQPAPEKISVERVNSAPSSSSKGTPSFKLSTPSNQSQSRVQYSNERRFDLSKISRDRPTPATSFSHKKEPIYTNIQSPRRPPRHNPSGDLSHLRVAGLRDVKGGKKTRLMDRPTQHHNFFSDAADVRQMEEGLLQLMEDFQAGNLRAFGKDSRLRQMEAIREQQESLARLHFEVGAEQVNELHPPLSEEGLCASSENKKMLMEKLAQLSESIEKLHTNANTERKQSTTERKISGLQNSAGLYHGHPNHHTGSNNQQQPKHTHNAPGSHHHPASQPLQPIHLSYPSNVNNSSNVNSSVSVPPPQQPPPPPPPSSVPTNVPTNVPITSSSGNASRMPGGPNCANQTKPVLLATTGNVRQMNAQNNSHSNMPINATNGIPLET